MSHDFNLGTGICKHCPVKAVKRYGEIVYYTIAHAEDKSSKHEPPCSDHVLKFAGHEFHWAPIKTFYGGISGPVTCSRCGLNAHISSWKFFFEPPEMRKAKYTCDEWIIKGIIE